MAKLSRLAEVGEEAKRKAQRELVLEAFREHGSDMEAVAKALGIDRRNIYETAERLGVDAAAERRKAARSRR